MPEKMPVLPETIENNHESAESSRMALVGVFESNKLKIEDINKHSDKYLGSDDKLVVSNDIRDKFPGMDEHTKRIMQQQRNIIDMQNDLQEQNKGILRQLAETNKDNESSKFVINEIVKDGRFFFDYMDECLEILKKGDIPQTLKDIVERISSGKIEKPDYFIHAYILTELTPGISDDSEVERINKMTEDFFNGSDREIMLLSTMLKAAKAGGEKIDFETIRNLKLEKRIIGEKDENGEEIKLSEEEKGEMLKMAEKNYREVVYSDNHEAAEAVISDLKKELDEGLNGQMLYTLRFQDQLAAFVRFKKLNDNEVYAGSLNVHQEVNNLCIGKYFTDSVLPEVAKQFRIRAITRAQNPALSLYKKQGFIIDEGHSFEKNGEKYYNMVMERKRYDDSL